MSLRLPTSIASIPAREASLGAIDAEVAAEQASSLARAGRRLEKALADLKSTGSEAGSADDDERARLLTEAKDALWCLIVQREACGFGSASDVLSAYGVPREVSTGVTPQPIVWYRRNRR